MAEKDISEKMLEALPDVFADIVNVLLFNGEEVVDPADLKEMSGWSGYKAEAGLHDQERDVAKWWEKSGIRIACVGFENQTLPDPLMVFRVYGYDGASYRIQCTKENRNKPKYAVVTMVLYFGTKEKWEDKAPTTLYETANVPDVLKPFVPNVKINVFNIAWLTDEQIGMFKSDFRIVADYFGKLRKDGKYSPTKDEIQHKLQLLNLFTVMEKDDRYIKAFYYDKIEGEIHNMCDVLDRVEKMGADKKEKELRESFAKKDEEMKESLAKKDTELKEMKESLAKKDEEMKKSLAKKDEEMKESFAKKMLAAGKPQDEVAEFSGLSKTTIAKLAKVIAVASL
ncbi:MAG: Rpn family recombination-promoting nuclease/putative transposase [Clostridia bacterium]|nr:Rpn family recombination-promoting nuclease/putative transposase [Clostridia bacterium]MBR1683701.1 Rpn family recombination-promoting nuclease/putative transposase [Clostridia bacterium]MBR2287678.1 Rpn family recombination-promoting nuclease/putative transposase [Clostridia bacterium]